MENITLKLKSSEKRAIKKVSKILGNLYLDIRNNQNIKRNNVDLEIKDFEILLELYANCALVKRTKIVDNDNTYTGL